MLTPETPREVQIKYESYIEGVVDTWEKLKKEFELANARRPVVIQINTPTEKEKENDQVGGY